MRRARSCSSPRGLAAETHGPLDQRSGTVCQRIHVPMTTRKIAKTRRSLSWGTRCPRDRPPMLPTMPIAATTPRVCQSRLRSSRSRTSRYLKKPVNDLRAISPGWCRPRGASASHRAAPGPARSRSHPQPQRSRSRRQPPARRGRFSRALSRCESRMRRPVAAASAPPPAPGSRRTPPTGAPPRPAPRTRPRHRCRPSPAARRSRRCASSPTGVGRTGWHPPQPPHRRPAESPRWRFSRPVRRGRSAPAPSESSPPNREDPGRARSRGHPARRPGPSQAARCCQRSKSSSTRVTSKPARESAETAEAARAPLRQ